VRSWTPGRPSLHPCCSPPQPPQALGTPQKPQPQLAASPPYVLAAADLPLKPAPWSPDLDNAFEEVRESYRVLTRLVKLDLNLLSVHPGKRRAAEERGSLVAGSKDRQPREPHRALREREGGESSLSNKDCESCKMAPFNTTPRTRNTDNNHNQHQAAGRRISTDPNTGDVEDHAPEVVKVAVRLRPLSEHENSWSAVECLRIDPSAQQVIFRHPSPSLPLPVHHHRQSTLPNTVDPNPTPDQAGEGVSL
jgi:hypothetical protein